MAIVTRVSYLQEQNMHGIECEKGACPNQAMYLTGYPLTLIAAGELLATSHLSSKKLNLRK